MRNAAEADPKGGATKLSKEGAVQRAADNIGLREYNSDKSDASLVTLSEECLPFLAQQLNGRRTWKVEFRDLDLQAASGNRNLANRYITHLVVILAPDSGQILKVTSAWPAQERNIAPYPSCQDEQRQMRASGKEYVGVPDAAPSAKLLSVLENADYWSPKVRQFMACYVLESTAGYKKKPVWVVQLRGFPAFEPSGGDSDHGISEEARNHFRSVFDAATGKWLGAGNLPNPAKETEKPLAPLEKRY